MPRSRRSSSRPPEDAAPRPDMRMRVYTVGVLFGLTVLGGRLVQLQGADAAALAKDALKQRTSETTLYAKRGDVVDSRGVVLATSVERRDVIRIRPRTATAPAPAKANCPEKPGATTKCAIATPNVAPALIPRTSGLAISLPVSR